MNIDRLFDALSTFGWITFGFVFLILFSENLRRYGLRGALLRIFQPLLLIFLLPPLLLTVIGASLVFVDPTQVAVVISFLSPRGYRDQPLESGRHWIVPIAEFAVLYPVSRQTYTMSGNPTEGQSIGNDAIRARTSDGQEISIDTSIIFSIAPEDVVELHIKWQQRYIDDLIRPLIRGGVREEVALFQVAEVNSSKRSELENKLFERLVADLGAEGLTVQQFLIRNITFTPEYALAIEQKQVALERATQSAYEAQSIREIAEGRSDEVRRLAEARADAVVLEAGAQASALELIRNALQDNQNLLAYRYIEKLAPNVRVMLLPSENPLFISMDALGAMNLPLEGTPNAADLLTPTSTPTPEGFMTPTPAPTLTPTSTPSNP